MRKKNYQPVALVIMDGWGIGKEWENNPIFLAPTPNIDRLLAEYPHVEIGAAGTKVGLTIGHQGSSEIGHYIMGAGRNVLLPQMEISKAIDDGSFFENKILRELVEEVAKSGKRLHLMGLLSDKGVHSYDRICHALLRMAARAGVKDVVVHVFSDGRDVGPKTVEEYLKRLEEKFAEFGVGRVGSIMGRWWAMDRDHRWERVERAYLTVTEGRGLRRAKDVWEAVREAYGRGETDEFIEPTVIEEEGQPRGVVSEGDGVCFFNYRVDRAIELTQAFVEEEFEGFPREKFLPTRFTAMTEYYEGIDAPVAFRRKPVKNCLGEVLSRAGLKQLRISETEKWVYLTTIFNGMEEEAFWGEERILIPSDKVATYDLAPRMQTIKIARTVAEKMANGFGEVYIMNFANPDILGHTANKEAVIEGIKTVDEGVGIVIDEVIRQNGVALVTADHGDAELIFDEDTGQPHTSHTSSDVPFILVGNQTEIKGADLRDNAILADIAPTVLDLLGIKKPREMTGASIIEWPKKIVS